MNKLGMDKKLFDKFCDLAYSKAGIKLKSGKESLVAARISKRLRILGIESAENYLEYLNTDSSGEEIVHFLDVISTNFTKFFREPDHFVFLSDIVKQWIVDGIKRLRIWSAASSSGEEPYSITITVLEQIGDKPIDFKLLATDISTRILAEARRGIYPASKIESFNKAQRHRYLERVKDSPSHQNCYSIRLAVKEHILFKRLNLAEPPFPMSGPIDVVFCRNVMIYFDREVRQNLISEIERILAPHGLLFIGHSETLTGINTKLVTLGPSLFCKEPERFVNKTPSLKSHHSRHDTL